MRDTRVSAALVLLAHGSRDPRSGAAIEALVCRIAAARPGLRVAAAYLEHRGPRPGVVFGSVADAGATDVVAVPLLLTAAYHGTVDVPAVLAEARATAPAGVRLLCGGLLGPDDRLLDALDARLRETAASGAFAVSDVDSRTTGRPEVRGCGADGLVLAAAGTRDARARSGVDAVARRLGARHGVPCVAAYAAGPGPDVSCAIGRLRAAGARRIAVASYFLAPGRLHDRIVAEARWAGALRVTAPFAATAPVVGITLDRFDACRAGSRGAGRVPDPTAGGHGVRVPLLAS